MSILERVFAARRRIASVRAEVAVPVRSRDHHFTLPRLSAKDRAILTARDVLKYEHAGITISPSETINLSREFLKALHLPEQQR